MMKLVKLLVLASALIGLTACATHAPVVPKDETKAPSFNHALFTPKEVIDVRQITHLSNDQKADFLRFFNDPKFALTPKLERVGTYLGLLLDGFEYSDKTYTASQALQAQSGNCLSLTVLTAALAELAGVDITYQLLDQNPVYSIDQNLLITSDHMRAVLRREVNEVDDTPKPFSSVSYIRIDYFQTDGLNYIDNISTDAQLSMFYSNLAVEMLASSELDRSFAYATKALGIYSANASALNTIGILHRRKGDLASAESIYQHGARYFAKAPMFVRNYAKLLEQKSDHVDLDALLAGLPRNSKDHPWNWIRAGKVAFSKGDYDAAVAYYNRALSLAPDLHQVHFYVSRANYLAGDERASKLHVEKALRLASASGDIKNYQRKLDAFKPH